MTKKEKLVAALVRRPAHAHNQIKLVLTGKQPKLEAMFAERARLAAKAEK